MGQYNAHIRAYIAHFSSLRKRRSFAKQIDSHNEGGWTGSRNTSQAANSAHIRSPAWAATGRAALACAASSRPAGRGIARITPRGGQAPTQPAPPGGPPTSDRAPTPCPPPPRRRRRSRPRIEGGTDYRRQYRPVSPPITRPASRPSATESTSAAADPRRLVIDDP